MPTLETDWRLFKIGRGSFADIWLLGGRPIAFKVVQIPTNGDILLREYTALTEIYNLCNSDSFFFIPRPFAYYDPSAPDSFASIPTSLSPRPSCRPLRSPVALADLKSLGLPAAVYAMDFVVPLPPTIAQAMRQFYPPNSEKAPAPSLCRLYFGKDIEGPPGRFFNSANFPLDIARYQRIAALSKGFPIVEDIAYGMGQMLGRLHWRAGYDARDIEFVLGGEGFSHIALYVIDFNQV